MNMATWTEEDTRAAEALQVTFDEVTKLFRKLQLDFPDLTTAQIADLLRMVVALRISLG
jgi:hypothetical protein